MPRVQESRDSGSVDTLVIGAGHAGLAFSRCLAERGVEHLLLERGEVANTWRRERWDSLTLLTPNWQSRLPDYAYSGDDPDGFMSMQEVIRFIDDYADVIDAPVKTETNVTSVTHTNDRYRVVTDRGQWTSRALVIASGACNLPHLPAVREQMPADIESITPFEYREPAQLAEGGVLIVGASATGLQLADEIHRSGRPVTIAVGEHVRLPRVYRGRDIQWWMHAAGILDEAYDEVEDIVRARRLPSPQLVGSRDRQILDLNALTSEGVSLVGRLMSVANGRAHFSGSLRNVCALADLKMNRLLETLDEWADSTENTTRIEDPERFDRTRVDDSPALATSLSDGHLKTIVWATGFRPDYGWLDLPVLDRKGQLRHDGGVVDMAGLYVIGLPVLRRRKSSFIHGAGDDAEFLASHLRNFLDTNM